MDRLDELAMQQPDTITIEVTKVEQAMIVASLEENKLTALRRSDLLLQSMPDFQHYYYDPNRELAKGWDYQAEMLENLIARVKDQ